MHLSDQIIERLQAASTGKQAVEIILEECFREEQQDAALDWCIKHRPELELDDLN